MYYKWNKRVHLHDNTYKIVVLFVFLKEGGWINSEKNHHVFDKTQFAWCLISSIFYKKDNICQVEE